VALLVPGLVPAQGVVIRILLHLHLVVKSAAASIVELLQNIPLRVTVALTVGSIRSELLDETMLDSPELDKVRCVVVDAAESKRFLGAVLNRERMSKNMDQ